VTCPKCRHDNGPKAKFCEECGHALAPRCAGCGAEMALTAKFCSECGRPSAPAPEKFTAPDTYTPKHLAEKILTSKAALEGERKSVTVMFSDVSGFTAMSERMDPE